LIQSLEVLELRGFSQAKKKPSQKWLGFLLHAVVREVEELPIT
jgi:hypothetical protein